MEFQLWGHSFLPLFERPGRWEAYLILTVYTFIFLFIVLRRRRDFARLKRPRLALFVALCVTTPVLNTLLLTLSLDPTHLGLLPPPFLAAEPIPPTLPLLGMIPIAIAAAWLGMGPAAIIGLLAGIFRAGATSHSLLEPFTLAFEATLIAYLLHQNYAGRLPALLRQPLVAFLTACITMWPVMIVSTFLSVYFVYFSPFYQPGSQLATLDYTLSIQKFAILFGVLEALLHGLLLQIGFTHPRLKPTVEAYRPPPYTLSLSRRFLFALIPVFVFSMAILIYAVFQTAVQMATQQAVNALARDATNGAEEIASFISTGQSLIKQFSADPALWGGDEAVCQERLRSDLQMLPYFNRLTAYDPQGQVICTYPPATETETALTGEERVMLDIVMTTEALWNTAVHRTLDGEVILSFESPLESTGGTHAGVLVGRVGIEMSPIIDEILDGLQNTMNEGEGFVVNADGIIVIHPQSERLLDQWVLDQSDPIDSNLAEGRGWISESRNSLTNARELVCYFTVEGHDWAVVVSLPYEIVLDLAINIAQPLLGLLVVLTVIIGMAVFIITNQLTRPLNLLAGAAGRIAAGDLDNPVHVAGEDEVAQLGHAFEKMRVGLKGRLEELSLLLRVSQAVSATLDLSTGMPIILEGALETTGASISRIILLAATGDPQVVMGRGKSMDGLGWLDRALAVRCRDSEEPLLIENLSQSPLGKEVASAPREVQAAIALPVRGKGRTVAVIWVGYPKPRRFEPSEVDLLSTLAGQTAVLVENARLFQMAEGGRRRLAAILASTKDAVLVTDRDDRILLINPAAEQTLNLRAREVMEQKVDEVHLEPPLVKIFTEPMSRNESLVEEVPLPNGRTFYANASTILSADGENMGRVVVMRDVTHFKELDEMKSEFVATVSHDLRAPLTFMRGYATMMPMVGSLTEKQQDYLDKILTGIEQTAGLVEDLLNLGRIEAGVGMEEKPCYVGALIVEAVDNMRARATAKGLTLRLEPSDPAPVIYGDATMLRQAIANLVDNAIKYTPEGGKVTVKMRTTDQILISVTDTGIGIAPEDQVRLFEKFFRIRRKESIDVPGTGLGLAIVKSIIERHGGRVWVDSILNTGTTFTIALPIREQPQQEEGAT
ncbi:MAG: HAMP domain-containing protein [Anaerolineae bacterium]|nr:HAMP domain-containing protein [Anaerolineae bacterium]